MIIEHKFFMVLDELNEAIIINEDEPRDDANPLIL